MKKISEIKNIDEVKTKIVELLSDHECVGYQEDIYLYIDEEGNGHVDTFMNISGNSWLADDHVASYPMKPDYDTRADRLIVWYGGPEELAEYVGVTIPEVDEYGNEVDPLEYIKDVDDDVLQKAWDGYKSEQDTEWTHDQADMIIDKWIREEEV